MDVPGPAENVDPGDLHEVAARVRAYRRRRRWLLLVRLVRWRTQIPPKPRR
jgi:hypothetical protein